MKQTQKNNILQLLIHVTGWGMFFGLPFLIFWKYPGFNMMDKVLHHTVTVLSLMTVFYLNYFVLTEKYLFPRKTSKFLGYNVLLILGIGIVVHYWQESNMPAMPLNAKFPPEVLPRGISFLLRDIVSLLIIAGLSVTIKMTGKWYKTEAERQEEQNERTEAELKNLRQQLNPHFLFNTLNNIYAQIAIRPEEAQNSMLELSKLLRYVLYENNGNFVPLERELNFIHNYVELMRIRLNPAVDMKININIAEKDKTVAPLLFITLIENAFKHGVSPTQHSFIDIDIHLNDDKQLNCTIRNSYFPKDESDQSGSGIGLENLHRRLEILYPHKHILRTEKEDDTFIAQLIIPLKNSNEL
ncbi:MAG: histidine kinase [Bacteroidota bacterium]|nr:histidine kinase [Bacteroidota bacterium]